MAAQLGPEGSEQLPEGEEAFEERGAADAQAAGGAGVSERAELGAEGIFKDECLHALQPRLRATGSASRSAGGGLPAGLRSEPRGICRESGKWRNEDLVWGSWSNEPEWRNGRRDGLKIRCPQGRVGSSPSSGTLENKGFAIGQPPRAVSKLANC